MVPEPGAVRDQLAGPPWALPDATDSTALTAAPRVGGITRPGPPTRRPGRARPAVLRRTRPGSPHRHSPGIWDGQRQLPAAGRLVRGIMPAAGDHSALGPGMTPGHAGDTGTVPSVLAPHDHLHIGDDTL